MRRLVLHVGPSKTASTTIQQYLSTYTNAETALTYPKWGWTRPDNGHHNLAYQLRNDARYVASLGGLNNLRQDLEKGRQLFLSSEDFPIYPPNLEALQVAAKEFGYTFEVLFFVRDPIARLNSMYTQQIKTFVETRRFSDFIGVAAKEDKLQIKTVVKERLESAGIKVTFAPFIGPKMGEIFARICHHYGFTAEPTQFEHTNPAPSPEEIALYRQIGHRMEKSHVNHWAACNQLSKKYGFNRKYFGFDAHLLTEVKNLLEPQYAEIETLNVLFLADELQQTFFKPREKCADILDETTFQAYKAEIIELMRL